MSSNQKRATRSVSICPNEEGWVAEFEAAQKAVKKTKCKKDFLRLAVTARTLRQWAVCQEASKSGLKSCTTRSDGPMRKKFLDCQAEAKKRARGQKFCG
jgi:hypothetical protein